jgi:hypothetical protein
MEYFLSVRTFCVIFGSFTFQVFGNNALGIEHDYTLMVTGAVSAGIGFAALHYWWHEVKASDEDGATPKNMPLR